MNYYDIKAVSNSLLGEVKHMLIYNKPRFTKRSNTYLRFGKGLHTAVLEPENFDPHEYTGAERMEIIRMADSFRSAYPTIFDGCISFEKEYFWNYDGWKCKSKVDAVDHDNKVLIDLKTTRATTLDEFLKSCSEYDYDRQAAWYLSCPALRDFDTFTLIGISKGNYECFEHTYERDAEEMAYSMAEADAILQSMLRMEDYKEYRV